MAHYLSNSEQEVKEYSPRFRWLYYFIGIAFFTIFCRLWYLQIIKGSLLREFSEKNRIKETRIPSARGIILDRNGEILVNNLSGYVAAITPQYTIHLEKTSETVGKILNISQKKIIKMVKRSKRRNGPFLPVKIKENLSREEVFRLKLIRLNHPGLEINNSIIRNYPLKDNGAQLFGYAGEISKKQLPILNKQQNEIQFYQGDIIGKRGLEKSLDRKIRGRDGVSYLEVDARGRELNKNSNLSQVFSAFNPIQLPQPGQNIQLTIDKDIQTAAFKAFYSRQRIGSIVALRPNGEVIAWVNAPSFDPNTFSQGISQKLWSKLLNDPFKPLRNKAIQDHTPPGSIFKPLVAIAALEEKVITPEKKIFCSGHINLGRHKFHCGSKRGHGNLNLTQALERSCNIYFYKLGALLGIDRIAKYAKSFGLGKKTNIDLPSVEVSGLIPTTKWKLDQKGEKWHPGETLNSSIGQGYVLVNPLQMALTFSAIGTKGKLFKPFLVKHFLDSSGKITKSVEPKQITDLSNLVSDKTFNTVIEGMRLVSNGSQGTARRWKVLSPSSNQKNRIKKIQIAGKTGTVQTTSVSADQIYSKCIEKPLKQRHHGWFVAFLPHDNPVITVAVLTEHSCSGSSGAAPVARDVLQAYIDKYPITRLQTSQKKKTSSITKGSSFQ